MFASRRTGRITITQWPNIPLWLFIVVAVVTRISHPSGSAATLARTVAVVALLVWALDEVLRGVNPFRRALGLAVVVVTLVGLAR
jgi:Na+/citrate or Na+/malate symporter